MGFFEGNDNYDHNKNRWVEKKADEFYEIIKSILKEEDLVDEVAGAIAWSHYNDEDCDKMFTYFGLDTNHALCYMGQTASGYDDEIDEAFQEFISDVDID